MLLVIKLIGVRGNQEEKFYFNPVNHLRTLTCIEHALFRCKLTGLDLTFFYLIRTDQQSAVCT